MPNPAFDFASKKAGHPVDRNTGEKITDAARGAYEKATGYVLRCCVGVLDCLDGDDANP